VGWLKEYSLFWYKDRFYTSPLSHMRAQGRRLIPFCFPILPSLRVPSSYILFGDIYSIGLRETVREEFPLCRIILENEMEIVFTLLPCVVLAV